MIQIDDKHLKALHWFQERVGEVFHSTVWFAG